MQPKKYVAILFAGLCCILQQAEAASYRYYLKVLDPALAIYASPATSARRISTGKKNQVFEVTQKKQKWLRIKVTIPNGGFVHGWVPLSTSQYKVLRKTVHIETRGQAGENLIQSDAKATNGDLVSAAQKRKPEESSQNSFREAGMMIYRGYLGPVYNIKDYFSSSGLSTLQYRFGLGVDRTLSETLWVSIPVMYAQGQGFKTLSTGANVYYAPLDFDRWIPYVKLGATFEYLFSSGRNFYGANVETGLGVDYVLSDTLAIGIEPISVQTMVYRSVATIPMNIRGQLLLSVRAKW